MANLLPDNATIFYQFISKHPETTRISKSQNRKKNPLLSRIAEKGPYYTPFDQYLLRVPSAIRAGKELIHKFKPEFILVNADPWSGLIAGHYLSKWANIPWIADLRDPWSLHAYKMALRPLPVKYLIKYFESVFFHSAAQVILNTRMCCSAYQEKYQASPGKSRFTWIRNAFDPECYTTPRNNHETNCFSLHYFGSFRIYQDSGPLFSIFKQFVTKHRLGPDMAELVLYGDSRNEETKLLQTMDLAPYVKYHNTVNLAGILNTLIRASVLVLIEGPNKQLQLPAKLYDYLATRKPILALTDNPELAEIISTTRSGVTAAYHDTGDALCKLEQLYFERDRPWHFNDSEITRYSVEYQIREFVRLFDKVSMFHS